MTRAQAEQEWRDITADYPDSSMILEKLKGCIRWLEYAPDGEFPDVDRGI